ncbi:MAG: DUF1636 domain-containing protein [Gammaproteobacteria bacterium]|nr:DUF1636 domain-containing protein [Gammaproteobacteria bacterium]
MSKRDRLKPNASETALIFVCGTCDRDKPEMRTKAGAALANAILAKLAAGSSPMQVRKVACLNGCRRPCNAAFRGHGRWTYRFSQCAPSDVDDLVAFGTRYWQTAQGEVSDQVLPPTLRAKLSVRTPPSVLSRDEPA